MSQTGAVLSLMILALLVLTSVTKPDAEPMPKGGLTPVRVAQTTVFLPPPLE